MTERLFRDGPAGPIYRVTLAPRERGQGTAIVFEEVGGWELLSTPVGPEVKLLQLSDRDLTALYNQARG